MDFAKVGRAFDTAAKVSRDLQALKRGRLKERIANRIIGKALSRSTSGIWR